MKKSYRILIHFLYWLYTLCWYTFKGHLFDPEHYGWHEFAKPLYLSFSLLGIGAFYINYFFIMPRYFLLSRYRKLWLSWVLLYIGFVITRYLTEEVWFPYWLGYHNYAENTTLGFYFIDNLYYAGSHIIMSLVIWCAIHISFIREEKKVLEEEKTIAEISFLKSQVNPHFLFNTLNNIYSLVYHQSEKALPAILKLSDLMRYITKEVVADKVPLAREISYIESVIELSSIRVNGKAEVVFTVDGATEGVLLSPLLLIPFVENGFKHGVLTDPAAPLTIELSVTADTLTLLTHNKVNQHQKDTTSGVGLDNVKRRLELLYPGRHQLTYGQQEEFYICSLILNLRS